MTHLEAYRKDYRYRTAPRGEVGTLTVEYEKDGWGRSPRGIYVHLRSTTIEDSGVDGIITESFMIGQGRKSRSVLMMELKRDTPAKTLACAELVDRVAPEAARLYMADQWEAAVAMVREVLQPVVVA